MMKKLRKSLMVIVKMMTLILKLIMRMNMKSMKVSHSYNIKMHYVQFKTKQSSLKAGYYCTDSPWSMCSHMGSGSINVMQSRY